MEEDEVEKTLRQIEGERQRQRHEVRALRLAWLSLALGLLLAVACLAGVLWLLPRAGEDPAQRRAWGISLGAACVGFGAGTLAVLFFLGRLWRLHFGVANRRRASPDRLAP